MKLLVVSGLSGSGKSVALNALEDLGCYCIDNLPLSLLTAFANEMTYLHQHNYECAAVGIDARNLSEDFQNFPDLMSEIKGKGVETEIIFLQADDATLIKRFSETRRKHPLTGDKLSLPEAIKKERKVLSVLSSSADLNLDTSHSNVHQLRDQISDHMVRKSKGLSLTFLSFGFKHGVPVDADFVFDIRCLPNPHWVPELRASTGMDESVQRFLSAQPLFTEMYHDLKSMLGRWLPHFEADNRSYITVAIGCTGGQHRSVYMAKRLSDTFAEQGRRVLLRHRELPS